MSSGLKWYYEHRDSPTFKEKRRKYFKGWKEKNPEKSKRIIKRCAKRCYDKLRLETFRHYGGNHPKCVCCGEDNIEFLTIDHINGNGAEHRRSVGSGANFYFWLKKNNYPEGFQVLCYNCNCALGHYGYCPHTRKPNMKQASNN
jgi:hypothetical protein